MYMHRDLIQQADAEIKAELQQADDEEARRALRECRVALIRCVTLDDVSYVREIFQMVKREAILSGVGDRLCVASRRLDTIVGRSRR